MERSFVACWVIHDSSELFLIGNPGSGQPRVADTVICAWRQRGPYARVMVREAEAWWSMSLNHDR